MRKTVMQLQTKRFEQARIESAKIFEQFMKYAAKNLNAKQETNNIDVTAAMRDAVISTLLSFNMNFFFADKLKSEKIINEEEYINFSNVHFNYAADELDKIFLSFDTYATVYNPVKEDVTAFIFGEINTYGGRPNKYVNYGLDRIQFIRKGLEEADSKYKDVKMIYIIVADIDDIAKEAIQNVARRYNIAVLHVKYSKLKSAFDATAIRVFSTNKKKLDVFMTFVEELLAAQNKISKNDAVDIDKLLSDAIEVIYKP